MDLVRADTVRARCRASPPSLRPPSAGWCAWLIAGFGFANYDTVYALVWGRDLARGQLPDYGVPVAPTPHPLRDAGGRPARPARRRRRRPRWWCSPSSRSARCRAHLRARRALVRGAPPARSPRRSSSPASPSCPSGSARTSTCPTSSWCSARCWSRRVARGPGCRCWVCSASPACCAPRPGCSPFAYVGWLALDRASASRAASPCSRRRRPRRRCCGRSSDLVVTGDPLHSLTGTRGQRGGPGAAYRPRRVPLTVPRRIGEILREPVLLGAARGRPARARLPAPPRGAAGRGRRARRCSRSACSPPPGCRSSGATCCCPRRCWRSSPGRARSAGRGSTAVIRGGGDGRSSAPVVALALVAFIPAQVDRLRHAAPRDRHPAHDQGRPARARRQPGVRRAAAGPSRVPNHRPVPLTSRCGSTAAPADILSAQLVRPRDGPLRLARDREGRAELHARPQRPAAADRRGAARLLRGGAQRARGSSTRGARAACAARGRRAPRRWSAALSTSAISGTVMSAPNRSAIASRSSALSAGERAAARSSRCSTPAIARVERASEPRRRAPARGPRRPRAARVVAQAVERDGVEPGLLRSRAGGRSRGAQRSARSNASASRSSASAAVARAVGEEREQTRTPRRRRAARTRRRASFESLCQEPASCFVIGGDDEPR